MKSLGDSIALRFIAAFLLLLQLPMSKVLGQRPDALFTSDTLSILFRLDSTVIDMQFADNAARWASFEQRFRQRYSHINPAAIRLDIYAGASPEGSADHNRWLGEQRGQAVRRLIRERLGRNIGHVVVHNEAARWDAFYDAVAQCNEPWRDEVLRIIDLPASQDGTRWDHRELKLRALHDGQVWPDLLHTFLAPLRSGATAIVSWQGACDTVFVRETNTLVHVPSDSLCEANNTNMARIAEQTVNRLRQVERRPAWILRSNLLLLATATPNLQAEWSLDHRDRWSVNVEGVWSWWVFSHNAYANEIMYASAEMRYWLGRRNRRHTLSGWHIGLGLGAGLYDLEWDSKGHQGEVFMGFLNLGWQHRFGKRRQWAFDAGIGIGYFHSPHRHYHGSSIFPEGYTERYDDHLMWQETKHFNWFGTPHVNLSIGYVFQPRNGAYRRAAAIHRDEMKQSFAEPVRLFEKSRLAERDSVYASWYPLSKAERKVAQKAYRDSLAHALDSAKAQARQAAIEAKATADAKADFEKARTKQAKAEAKAEARAAAIQAKALRKQAKKEKKKKE